METIIISSEQMNEVTEYYTELNTDIAWEDNTATENFDRWNATAPTITKAVEGTVNVTHVVLASVALLVINLAVIVGNILVLLAVYCERALRTVTNYFIVNLAIADLLLGTLVLPFSSAFEVIHYWPFGGAFCDIWAAVDVLCCTASINSLCCISVDRYIGVTKPLKHRLIMTPKRAIMINIFVWFISFGIAVGPLFGWRPVKTSKLECPLSDSIGYVFFSVAGSFYIPSAIILVLYFRIYRAVSRETKTMQDRSRRRYGDDENGHAGRVILRIHVGNKRQSGGNCSRGSGDLSLGSSRPRNLSQRTATFNREKKVAKTLGIVVGVFILCWFPFFFLLPLMSVCRTCKLPEVAFTFFFWLGYCNSCVNPIIYAMANLTFRKAFRKIITCWYCRDRHPLRRTFGSRRFSNVSRLTSSTPMSSPVVTSRGKRLTPNTSSGAMFCSEYAARKRVSKRKHDLADSTRDYRICEADVYKSNANQMFCDLRFKNDRCGISVGRMPTIESESTTDNNSSSVTGDEKSKSLDTTNQTKCSPDQTVLADNTTLSDNTQNSFEETLTETFTRYCHSPCFRPDTSREQRASDSDMPESCYSQITQVNTEFRFKQLTDNELSNGIHDSRETSV